MKKSLRKLSLHRETLGELVLFQVSGGATSQNHGSCASCSCSCIPTDPLPPTYACTTRND
jgi:hypothetical protein